MNGPIILLSGFVALIVFAYLVGRFSPNLWVVFAMILGAQTAGYLWGLGAGIFFGESILEIISVLAVSFVWYMIAAQMHFWVKGRTIEPADKQ
ncbi:MAG: hypothetical protein WBC71_00840 [Salaquimonas sp.]